MSTTQGNDIRPPLCIRNLNVTYRSGERVVRAVRGVDIDVPGRGMTALVGESGSGKSTLVMAILGLLPRGTEISGDILLGGESLAGLDDDAFRAYRWKRIALVPQGAMNAFTPVLTVGHHIRETLEFHLRMTREEIGSYLGLKLETVSRAFSRFQEEGLIGVQQKHIRLLDTAGLRKLNQHQTAGGGR